jgi:mitochondrial fission protein ELM1
MYPGSALAKRFDHVITPKHDEVEKAKNIIQITGSVTATKKMPKPTSSGMSQVAVLVGSLSESEAKELTDILNKNKALYLITTSRRTPEESAAVLDSSIRQPHQLYKFGSKGKNPYESFLESADIIMVTGDSVNMATEAAHTGKPVYIMEVETKEKFKQFWQELYDLEVARKLEENLESWEYKPLDNIKAIKKQIDL